MVDISQLIGGGSLGPFYNDPLKFVDYTDDLYYCVDVDFNNYAARSVTADYIHFAPFIPKKTHTFTGICFYNTETDESGNNLRLGIYSSSNNLPNAIVDDCGVATLGASAAFEIVVASNALTYNTLYWLCILPDTNSTINMVDVSAGHLRSPMIFAHGIVDDRAASPIGGIRYSYSYSTLPSSITQANLEFGTAIDIPLLYLEA